MNLKSITIILSLSALFGASLAVGATKFIGSVRIENDPDSYDPDYGGPSDTGGIYTEGLARFSSTAIYGTLNLHPKPNRNWYDWDSSFGTEINIFGADNNNAKLTPVSLILGYQNGDNGGCPGFILGWGNSYMTTDFVFGHNNNADTLCMSFGKYNNTSYNSLAFGELNIAEQYSFAFGYKNSSRFASLASGAHSKAMGAFSFAGGYGVVSGTTGQISLGMYNDDSIRGGRGRGATGGSAQLELLSWSDVYIEVEDIYMEDPLFVLGNGTSDTARSNAMVILKNGNATINGTLKTKRGGDIRMGVYGREADQ